MTRYSLTVQEYRSLMTAPLTLFALSWVEGEGSKCEPLA
jgi:hypothetical protein